MTESLACRRTRNRSDEFPGVGMVWCGQNLLRRAALCLRNPVSSITSTAFSSARRSVA